MKCVYNYCIQSCVFLTINSVSARRFRQSTTNRYPSIPIYLSIGIDNRYQSITTWIFAIDWSSIININRLIDIDWYRLISIIIDWIPRGLKNCFLYLSFIISQFLDLIHWMVFDYIFYYMTMKTLLHNNQVWICKTRLLSCSIWRWRVTMVWTFKGLNGEKW